MFVYRQRPSQSSIARVWNVCEYILFLSAAGCRPLAGRWPAGGRAVAGRLPAGCRPVAGRWPTAGWPLAGSLLAGRLPAGAGPVPGRIRKVRPVAGRCRCRCRPVPVGGRCQRFRAVRLWKVYPLAGRCRWPAGAGGRPVLAVLAGARPCTSIPGSSKGYK